MAGGSGGGGGGPAGPRTKPTEKSKEADSTKLLEQALAEAYAKGYAVGYTEGEAAGRAEGANDRRRAESIVLDIADAVQAAFTRVTGLFELNESEISEVIQRAKINRIVVEELDLTVRSYNTLKRHGIHVVGEILGLGAEKLGELTNVTQRMVDEIRQELAKHGATLDD